MEYNHCVVTYLVKGVKTTSRSVQVPIPANEKYKSIYSMYPIGCNSLYNFEAMIGILVKYKDQMKPNEFEENMKIYAKCIEEFEDTAIGLFINHDKAFPAKYGGAPISDFPEIKKAYESVQKSFDELFDMTQKKVAVAPVVAASVVPTVTVETKAAPAAPAVQAETKVKTKAKAIKDDNSQISDNSEDFDPNKWRISVVNFEATKPELETEIKALEESLATQFDIVSSNRLKKRQRMLASYPATLEILKANLVAKQNYYADGLQANYETVKVTINTYITSDYLNEHMAINMRTALNTPNIIPHLARNPALLLQVEAKIKDHRKHVNRLRVNKADRETWVQALETEFEALKAEIKKSKYYVNIPQL